MSLERKICLKKSKYGRNFLSSQKGFRLPWQRSRGRGKSERFWAAAGRISYRGLVGHDAPTTQAAIAKRCWAC